MKKALAIILSVIFLFSVGLNVYAITDDYSSMSYADSVSLGSSKSHYFAGGGSDYQAWFKFRPTETNYYKFSASSGAYLSVKLYNSSHGFIDSDYGNYVEVGTMMYAYNEYYLWVDSGERYNGHYINVVVQKEDHNISSSNFSVTFDDGNKYYYQDGNPIYPNVTVYGNGTTLRLNRDFTVTYKNNKNVGTGTVTIEGVGDYTGTVSKTFSIVSHTHSWGMGTVTTAATCKNTGTKKYTCSVCSAIKIETIPKTSTHNYIEKVSSSNLKTEATCKSAAVYYKSCSVCGAKNYNSTFISGSIDATKHIYDNICDASCNICGEERRISHTYSNVCDIDCNVCFAKREEVPHTYDDKCDTTCNECGFTRKAPHIYDNISDLICNGCGYERPHYALGDIYGEWTVTPSTTGIYNISATGVDKDTIVVYDKNGCEVKLYDAKQGWPLVSGQEYTVRLRSNGDKITNANFVLSRITSKLFPDTQAGGWYNDAVTYAVSTGIMKGYSNGKFGTSDGIQRQDFLVMLARFDGVDLSLYANTHGIFRDVSRNSYFEAAVNWGYEHGIVTGYQDGRFGVGDKITREQIVTFLCRYARYKGIDTSYSSATKQNVSRKYYDYRKVSDFAEDSVLWAIEKGVINGKENNTAIAPQGNAQRCEVAQIMYNIFLKDIF